jgi:16S rRNA (uracil1498-N3)-methyltransferase
LEAFGAPLADHRAACRLTLAAAVPKGERFDWLVEKATELGVERLVPLVTERSAVDPRATKLERLRRRIVEASKQCGRNRLMVLEAPMPWSEWLSAAPASATRLLAHPGGPPPRSWPVVPVGGEAALSIGPEGGFSEPEVDAASAAGWRVVALGETLLRIETAAVAGVAMILARVEAGAVS